MLEVGQKLPTVTLKIMTGEGIKDVSTEDIFAGKKIALFAVPGAFTPTCSNIHLPSFAQASRALKDKSVDAIYCLAVNDPFVLEAWKKSAHLQDEISMLSDGNCDFTRQVGMELDGSKAGLGWRSKRYSLLAEDGVIKILNIETTPGECKVSDGGTLVAQM